MRNNIKQFIELPNKLAFDLGAYDGKDTINLMKAGYTVVSVEANPYRFKTKIKPLAYVYNNIYGENVCIGNINNKLIDFYLSKTYGVWDSCNKEIAERLNQDSKLIKVKSITILQLFEKYGYPQYIKSDIEGNDIIMLQTLQQTNFRPKYISCESECQGKTYNELKKYEVLNKMLQLGYSKFFLIDCYKYGENEMLILPETIQEWESYENIKNKIDYLSDKYYKMKKSKSIWADIYCSN